MSAEKTYVTNDGLMLNVEFVGRTGTMVLWPGDIRMVVHSDGKWQWKTFRTEVASPNSVCPPAPAAVDERPETT